MLQEAREKGFDHGQGMIQEARERCMTVVCEVRQRKLHHSQGIIWEEGVMTVVRERADNKLRPKSVTMVNGWESTCWEGINCI
jgi:hypothetical protein